MTINLLLLSSSAISGSEFLAYALEPMGTFLDGRTRILFVPYAGHDYDQYTKSVAEAVAPLGANVTGIHQLRDAVQELTDFDAMFVGGGNTFRLLQAMQRFGLMEPSHSAVVNGQLAYIGASAGTNLASPSIRTTNDMPIVQPSSFDALGLIPFQINPHYLDPDPNTTHRGETREQRIAELLEENDIAVLGLREGSWLTRTGGRLELSGNHPARLFRHRQDPIEIDPGSDVSWLLDLHYRFDIWTARL